MFDDIEDFPFEWEKLSDQEIIDRLRSIYDANDPFVIWTNTLPNSKSKRLKNILWTNVHEMLGI